MLNNSFADLKIPTAKDIPTEMVQLFVETPHPQGPYGARGLAEHPMIAVPSAVGNAIANATGVEFFELPLDPERVFLGLKHAAEGHPPTGPVTAAAKPAAKQTAKQTAKR
jgi:CO/xanthine dehydrogenase Mo-binding subunit